MSFNFMPCSRFLKALEDKKGLKYTTVVLLMARMHTEICAASQTENPLSKSVVSLLADSIVLLCEVGNIDTDELAADCNAVEQMAIMEVQE